jgi:hypothetical protein
MGEGAADSNVAIMLTHTHSHTHTDTHTHTHTYIHTRTQGKFAFVEFRNPDMATAALALHQQVQLMGCNLAVARPSGYMDPVKAGRCVCVCVL